MVDTTSSEKDLLDASKNGSTAERAYADSIIEKRGDYLNSVYSGNGRNYDGEVSDDSRRRGGYNNISTISTWDMVLAVCSLIIVVSTVQWNNIGGVTVGNVTILIIASLILFAILRLVLKALIVVMGIGIVIGIAFIISTIFNLFSPLPNDNKVEVQQQQSINEINNVNQQRNHK